MAKADASRTDVGWNTIDLMDPSGSVIVVGAGPAGASLAYLLASRGVSATLLERHRDFAREFRGEVLLPSGLKALHEIGLGDVVPSIPHVAPTAIAMYANARPVFQLPVGLLNG